MKWLHVFMVNSILILMSACSDEANHSSKITTFSVVNSHAWSGIDSDSRALAGKCTIDGNNIVYTRVDLDYSGTDECNWSGVSGEYYGIDFSSSEPKLEAKVSPQG